MQHFIWVFTVCKSTYLGVSNTQRVNQFACDPVIEVQGTLHFKIYLYLFNNKSKFLTDDIYVQAV